MFATLQISCKRFGICQALENRIKKTSVSKILQTSTLQDATDFCHLLKKKIYWLDIIFIKKIQKYQPMIAYIDNWKGKLWRRKRLNYFFLKRMNKTDKLMPKQLETLIKHIKLSSVIGKEHARTYNQKENWMPVERSNCKNFRKKI